MLLHTPGDVVQAGIFGQSPNKKVMKPPKLTQNAKNGNFSIFQNWLTL